jgi:hypothetical protein
VTELTEEIISDPGRPPVVAQRREDGVLWIHAPKTIVALTADEAERLAVFIRDEARLLRYPTATPAKARFEQVDG